MKVFVTGASGYIGSAIVQGLLAAKHQVLALARSDDNAAKLSAAGCEIHRGSLEDFDSLRSGAAASDGVIHCGFIHDFADMPRVSQIDCDAIIAMGEALMGTDRPLVIASALSAVVPSQGDVGTENDPSHPTHFPRTPSENATLGLASRGVRSSIVRLPPTTHGDGDKAFIPALIHQATQDGYVAYVGDGQNTWPAVHRLDAAHLFVLALEKGPAGSRFHAVGDEALPYKEIAEAMSRGLGLPTKSVGPDELPGKLGYIGVVAGLSIRVSAKITREVLGWKPEHVGLIEDLDKGKYFAK